MVKKEISSKEGTTLKKTYTKDEIFVLLKPGQEVKQDSLLNVTCKKLDISLQAYLKMSWSSRQIPEDQINRKPGDQKMTKKTKNIRSKNE